MGDSTGADVEGEPVGLAEGKSLDSVGAGVEGEPVGFREGKSLPSFIVGKPVGPGAGVFVGDDDSLGEIEGPPAGRSDQSHVVSSKQRPYPEESTCVHL